MTTTDSGPNATSPALGTAGDSAAGAAREGDAPAADKPTVDLPADAKAWVDYIKQVDEQIKDLEERKKAARLVLEDYLGEAEEGVIDGQVVVRWTYVRSNRFDTTKLKQARPDLYREFLVEGLSRRFTLPAGGGS